MRKLLVLILSLFMMALSFATTIKGKVIKVADGDTITILEENGDKTRVRFYGIDAPEKKQEYGIKSLE
ncbi:MAG: thermonuclease family protein [Cetobacterium sp.]